MILQEGAGDRRAPAAKSPQMKDPQAFLTVPTGGKVKVEDDFDDCEVGEEEEGCEAPVDPGGLLEVRSQPLPVQSLPMTSTTI